MLNIYKASAGSGKTFALAGDYLRLLLGIETDGGKIRLNPMPAGAHRSILAITFTNKATEEMKTRIIHELAVLAGMEPGWTAESPHAARLSELFGCSREELANSAGIALQSILQDFNGFNISTIDAFFQSILRTFAYEVDLPGNYELELDDKFVVSSGVNDMLTAFNLGEDYFSDPHNRRLEAWISAFLHSEMRDGRSFNIFNRQLDIHSKMIELINGFLDESYTENSAEFEKYFAEPDRIVEFARVLSERRAQLISESTRLCREALEACQTAGIEPKTNEKKILSRASVGTAEKTVAALSEDGTKAFPVKIAGSEAAVSVAPVIEDAARALLRAESEMAFINGVRSNLFMLGLLERVVFHIREFTRENSTLLLKDTNAILNKIIGSDPTPFIYERVGVTLRHFLIDEFQDTSKLQWQNLSPLIENSLSDGSDNLIIGDEKQSIYRFRNADPTLLSNLHKEFVGNSKINGDNISGNTNWRSSADIVRLNNTLFTEIANTAGISDVYGNVAQQVSKKNIGRRGYVKFIPFASKSIDGQHNAFRSSIVEMRRQLGSGYRPCDIAFLFRKRKIAAEFIDYLMNTLKNDETFPRISVVSDDSLLLFSSPAVQQVVSTLRHLTATDFVYDRRNVSMRVIAHIHSHFDNAINRGQHPAEALKTAIANRDIEPEIKGLQTVSKAEGSTLSAVVQIIIDNLDPKQRENENAYLTAFMDLVTDFSTRGANDLRSFVEWLDSSEALNTTISPGEDSNAIRVLTIHKAKGLDYKCVHLPYLDGRTKLSGPKWFERGSGAATVLGLNEEILPPLIPLIPGEWMLKHPVLEPQYLRMKHESLLDTVNVLYVAFTRAVDELIVGIADDDVSPEGTGIIKPSLERITDPGVVSELTGELLERLKQQRDKSSSSSDETLDKLIQGINNGRSDMNPFIVVDKDENGVYSVGTPAKHIVRTDGVSRTALEATETLKMPVIRRHRHESLWADTILETNELEPDNGLSTASLLRFFAGKTETIRDITATVSRAAGAGRITQGRADALTAILKERLNGAGVSQWYGEAARIYRNRIIETGQGGTVRADRIVYLPDDSVDVIIFTDESPESTEKAEKRAGYCAYLLRKSGIKRVFGWIWNPAEDEPPRRAALK